MPSLLPILSYDVAVQDGACDIQQQQPQQNTTTSTTHRSNVGADGTSTIEATKLMVKAVYAVQSALYNGLKSSLQLKAATPLLTQSEYKDVVTERSITKQCGYPLCENTLRLDKAGKGRYHISLRDHKVYSLEETRLYCSSDCIVDSKRFCAGLPTNRESILKHEQLEEIISCVRGLSLATAPVSSNGKVVSATDLTVHERTDTGPNGTGFERGAIDSLPSLEIDSLPALESPVRKGADAKAKSPTLKSAIKQSPRKHQRISWADEKPADDSFSFGTEALFDVLPGQNGLDRPSVAEKGETERLEIAQAVAEALSDAASAVSAGKVKASEAASSTGLSIVSPGTILEEGLPEDKKRAASHNEDPEPELPALREIDSIEDLDLGSRSPWLDAPPEEYRAELSTFGTIWVALDGWVSAATLAHVYNRDGSTEEFLNVNHRVEARPSDEDVTSVQIAKTMSGCISRALPEVVRALAISTPISVIEQSVGRLLRTMNMSQALPPLSAKQWRMISLLFLDALSTYRLAPLGPQLGKNKDRLQKVLRDSGTDESEYERYKELLLPVGR